MNQPLWRPDAARIEAAAITAFHRHMSAKYGVGNDYAALHRFSIDDRAAFWREVWDFCAVVGTPGERVLENGDDMLAARWFPDAKLNFAQNLLRRRDEADALVFWGETAVKARLSFAELYTAVAQCAAALAAAGVKAGDRVAAYMPNHPHTVIAMLAATSLGAIFTSASPDFGVQGVLDRFGQTEPKVLFTVDGYWYGGKTFDIRDKVAAIVASLPSVETVVVSPYLAAQDVPNAAVGAIGAREVPEKLAATAWLGTLSELPSTRAGLNVLPWHAFLRPHRDVAEVAFTPLPFDHPLYILYSSGTTGVPKCIVHRAGGVLLQHLKEHRLHGDIRRDDRVFYFTTCGWMMWNWLVSALASEATVLLYDGSPFAANGQVLFDFVDAEAMTHFGTSAKFLDAAAKQGLRPIATHRLEQLRTVFSTGSPLAPEGFDYVYEAIKRDVCLSSISGGTDICSCFVLGNPTLPVWRGEIQCKGLGMAVAVYDEHGQPVVGQKGELVCTRAFPSQPLGFWNDPDGKKYRAAYFERFAGVWHHGDYCEETPRGGFIIYGRSDATLNPGGVRIGTAEIYRQVEKLDEVLESVVIGQRWDNDERVVLFVKLREGVVLDAALQERIRRVIRDNTTPRHVPARIVAVPDIPRTKSGKIVELAVRQVVHGEPVKNVEALANPEALEYFRNRAELQR